MFFVRSRSTHLSIGHAHPQVDPGVTELKALLAARRQGRDVVDLIKVRTAPPAFRVPLERKADGLQESHRRLFCVWTASHLVNSLSPGAARLRPVPRG